MSELTFQYPTPYLLLILLGAVAISALLYFRNDRQKDIPKSMQILLAIIRGLAIFLIGVLLLSPLIKNRQLDTQKPIVLVAYDNSASLLAVHDSTELARIVQSLEDLKEQLGDDYDIKSITFGEGIKDSLQMDFSEQSTNIGQVFEESYNQYGAENLAAVVLVTDGIFNEGRDPVYALDRLKIPVYSVMLGDTTQRKDLTIKKVFHNKIAYLGDKFKVQVDISAYNFDGQSTRLRVSEITANGSQTKHDIPISINKGDFFTTLEVELEAVAAGVRRFRFSLSPLEGEMTTANNTRDIYIDVLDSRQKILLLANSPHPDISAMRQVLERNQNFEVEHSLLRDFNRSVQDFDLVILHQLPSKGADIRNLLQQMDAKQMPRLFIVGSQTDLNAFNNYQTAVRIRSNINQPNEVQAKVDQGFSLFTLEEKTRNKISQFVPLAAPFGEYSTGAGVDVLLYQKIGQVETEYPLLLFQASGNSKTGILLAEGFYKWRFFDYLQHENTEISDEIIQKTITFLNVKEDKRRFRAYTAKNIFNENEAISFGAELYNESYELINEPDALLSIFNEEGQEFPFVFNKRGKGYYVEPGLFPIGQYSYTASTTYDGKKLDFKGQFSIQPIEKELFELTANHGNMRRISSAFGGRAVYPAEVSTLPESILENRKIRSVIYESTVTKPGIDFKWIFFLIIVLLAVEWFLRKYFGSY